MQRRSDPIDELEQAVAETGAIIAGILPDQAELPTPCGDWTVGDLVEHVVRDVRMFAARAEGRDWQDETPTLDPAEWPDAYQDAADALISAWREGGALEEVVELPFGEFPRSWFIGQQLSDLVVHGWDLTRATGQSTGLDEELCESSLQWGRQNLRPEFRGKDFGPEVPVPDDAPAIDRLVGFFGRDPGWGG